MDLLKETEQFLEDIHDSAKKQASITQFDRTVISRVGATEEMRSITLRLVTALQEEADPSVKHAIFWILETAVCYYDQAEYIDWGVVIAQLPLLSEDGLLMALDMFYSRLQLSDILVLKTYLEHPSLMVRMNTLNIMCETIAFASHRDREVEAQLRPKHYHHLQMMINNPARRQQVSEVELEKLFLKVRHEVIKCIQTWFERSGHIWR